MKKEKYTHPALRAFAFSAQLMQLPDSQTETDISEEPATEPALAPGRDDLPARAGTDEDVANWGNLW